LLTNALRILLYLGMLWAIWAIISTVMELNLLGRDFTEEEGRAAESMGRLVFLANIPLYHLTILVFCLWIYRMNHNIWALGARGLRFSPGWAVGWFFVPIWFLWKPYGVMKELWKASQNPHSWSEVPVPRIFPIWWTLWIFATILTRIIGHFLDGIHGDWLTILSGTAYIPLCLMASIIVSRISHAQKNFS